MAEIFNTDSKKEYVQKIVNKYSDMLFRICYCILCNKVDAEDALQDTFVKLLTKAPSFTDEEHEKAWLIKVATNISRNILMLRLRRSTYNLEEIAEIGVKDEDSEVFEAIMVLKGDEYYTNKLLQSTKSEAEQAVDAINAQKEETAAAAAKED